MDIKEIEQIEARIEADKLKGNLSEAQRDFLLAALGMEKAAAHLEATFEKLGEREQGFVSSVIGHLTMKLLTGPMAKMAGAQVINMGKVDFDPNTPLSSMN